MELKNKDYEAKFNSIRQMISSGSCAEEIISSILDCVKLLVDNHCGNRDAVINGCIFLTSKLFFILAEHGLVNACDEKEQEDFIGKIRKNVAYPALLALFEDYYKELFSKTALFRLKESEEIFRVKQYVKEHYNERITLKVVSDYIGINASYLSVLFKKETGQNFKSYLTEIRMKEAINLINCTDMNMRELAEAVGYKDVKRFRFWFREAYGMSPQQYKKRVFI